MTLNITTVTNVGAATYEIAFDAPITVNSPHQAEFSLLLYSGGSGFAAFLDDVTQLDAKTIIGTNANMDADATSVFWISQPVNISAALPVPEAAPQYPVT